MTREEIRLQVAISVIQGVLEAKHGVIGEVVPSVAVAIALRIADAFVEEWYRETKEQKPIEKPINWTELTWKDIVELEGIINNVHYEFRNGIGQESFGKEVLEKFCEYKGDEHLDEIEQKPAEWGEEDKEAINGAIKILLEDYLPNEIIGTCTTLSVGEIVKRLKSLCSQPHWKPSKEQMEQLNSAANLPEFGPMVTTRKQFPDLESLYNDLNDNCL